MDIVLALGAGGPRGAAHIGVLRVLQANGYRVRAVSGASIGSIVAALYASGRSPDEIEAFFVGLEPSSLNSGILSGGAGLLGNAGVAELLDELFGRERLEDLAIPCAIVAVDLRSHQEVTFTTGPVAEALLGSIAVPGLYPPHELPPYLLVDGGVLDPVPVQAARSLSPRLPVLAVTLHTPIDAPELHLADQVPLPSSLMQRITRLALAQTVAVFFEAADLSQRQLARLRLALDMPDVVIHPDVGHIHLLDRVSVPAVAALGEQAAREALPRLRKLASPQARLRRALGLRASR
jgi:NTE family protein